MLEVIAATFVEIACIKEKGRSAADIDKVNQNWIQVHRNSMRENCYWLSHLESSLLQGTDPASILDYEQRVAAVTPDEVSEAARRYFKLVNYMQVVLYPKK
jgi:zinc protease